MGLKEIAKKFAGIKEGHEIIDENGIGTHVIKGDDDSMKAGFEYGLEAL